MPMLFTKPTQWELNYFHVATVVYDLRGDLNSSQLTLWPVYVLSHCC